MREHQGKRKNSLSLETKAKASALLSQYGADAEVQKEPGTTGRSREGCSDWVISTAGAALCMRRSLISSVI